MDSIEDDLDLPNNGTMEMEAQPSASERYILEEVEFVLSGMLELLDDLDSTGTRSAVHGKLPCHEVSVVTATEKFETKDRSTSTLSSKTQESSTSMSITIQVSDMESSAIVSMHSTSTNTKYIESQDQMVATDELPVVVETDDIGTMTVSPSLIDTSTSPKRAQPLTIAFTNKMQPPQAVNNEAGKENTNPMTLIQSVRKAPTLRLGLSRNVTKPLNIQRFD